VTNERWSDVRRVLLGLSRFFRLSTAGFSMMLPILGAAVVSSALSPSQVVRLAAVGLAFHIFGFVTNDVVDLPIDRTEPLRANSPLVRGVVRPAVALWVALVPVPAAAAIHALAGERVAAAALMIGMALGSIYNVYGKRHSWPILPDAAQSLAWVALLLFGAASAAQPLGSALLWQAAMIFCYVMLVNGIHGGIRDLKNDSRHGARTTVQSLGARLHEDGTMSVPRAVIVYGVALQLLLLAAEALFVVEIWPRIRVVPRELAVLLIASGHAALIPLARVAMRHASPTSVRLRAGTRHLLLSMALVCLPAAFVMNACALITIVACYVTPPLLLRSQAYYPRPADQL
jgi:4-hydroxybenzoate polyprenyltransferase